MRAAWRRNNHAPRAAVVPPVSRRQDPERRGKTSWRRKYSSANWTRQVLTAEHRGRDFFPSRGLIGKICRSSSVKLALPRANSEEFLIKLHQPRIVGELF